MNPSNYTDEQLQAAVDEAFLDQDDLPFRNLQTYDDGKYWPAESTNRLAIARAFLAALPARPAAAEIARLKAELAEAIQERDLARERGFETADVLTNTEHERDSLKAELAKWRSGRAAQVVSASRDREEAAVERAEKAEAELSALRQPILADDSWSLEQAAIQAHENAPAGMKWIAAAKAVVAAARPAIEAEALAKAVRRMEAEARQERPVGFNSALETLGAAEATQPSVARKVIGQHGPKGSPNLCGPSMPDETEPSTQVPLGPEDCPPGSVFRNSIISWYRIKYAINGFVRIDMEGSNLISYEELKDLWQINTSLTTGRWDATAWRPCSKPGK